ncbi:hypothetical protein CBL_20125 [Carabus blaptoides fortunei]
MDPTLIKRTELHHELSARCKNVDARSVPEMRKILTRCMKSETVTGPLILEGFEADPVIEIDICKDKLNELKDFEVQGTKQFVHFGRFSTRVAHLLGRISRIKTDDENLLRSMKTLRNDVIILEDQCLESIIIEVTIITVTDSTPKRLEAHRSRVTNFQPPPTNRQKLLERHLEPWFTPLIPHEIRILETIYDVGIVIRLDTIILCADHPEQSFVMPAVLQTALNYRAQDVQEKQWKEWLITVTETYLQPRINYLLSTFSNDSRPHLEVNIYGYTLKGLLDSGASKTVVGKAA